MIDELKQILTMIQNVPDMVLHVLLGFAVYKVVIFLGTSAGIYGTIRLGILKWHDYKTKVLSTPKITTVEHKLENVITCDDTHGRLMLAIESIRGIRSSRITKKSDFSQVGRSSQYIHSMDVDFLLEAIKEKTSREMSEVSK